MLGITQLPIKTIVDVGANKGQFAQKTTLLFPDAKFYCFEPLLGPFQILERWSLNINANIEVFNLALGDERGKTDMNYHINHDLSSSILKSTELTSDIYPITKNQEIVSVNIDTLDDFFSDKVESIQADLLIKLDVQGFEDRVIKGGKKVFSIAKAVIIEVNIDSLYEGQASFNKLVVLLSDLGFDYAGNIEQAYSNQGKCIYLDALFKSNDRKNN